MKLMYISEDTVRVWNQHPRVNAGKINCGV